jgi:IS605 OrfB family transposase
MEIKKTLSLRILRPLYSEEVEKKIREEKAKRKEIYKNEHLPPQFWSKIKKEHPTEVFWPEFADLTNQLQKVATEAYNSAISKIYISKVVNREKGSIEKMLSKVVYHELYDAVENSYIAIGLRQKIKSNFRYKELLALKSALPSAKADSFPLPFYLQEDFKIKEHNGDFVIWIPFPQYKEKEKRDKFRPWEKFEFIDTPKKRYIPVILSTERRQRNFWKKDEGTDAEVRRVLKGEYKVKSLEILKGKKIGEKSQWFVNLSIKYEVEPKEVDKNIIGGIDIGVSSPIVCAVSNSLSRLHISRNDILAFHKKMIARRRTLLRRNRYKRSGHGSKSKLKPITDLTKKSERFRKSIIRRWAKEVAEFFKREKAGVVQMEDLSGIKNREEETFFAKLLRTSWNYAQMQEAIKNKLNEYGIEVKDIKPQYTSQVCHSCKHLNSHFNFQYREANKFPLFKCEKCGTECNADYNAAKNMTDINIGKLTLPLTKRV